MSKFMDIHHLKMNKNKKSSSFELDFFMLILLVMISIYLAGKILPEHSPKPMRIFSFLQ